MIIKSIRVNNDGFVDCESTFYKTKDLLNKRKTYHFSVGKNRLTGEIDSGIWAVSYLLSMYQYRPYDFVLFKKPEVIINDSITMSLTDLSEYTCYMDSNYPLFSSEMSVKELVMKGIELGKSDFTCDEIKDMFMFDERFERPISALGGTFLRGMAAVGFAFGKQIFCFPWTSKMRYQKPHIKYLTKVMKQTGKIAIIPVGYKKWSLNPRRKVAWLKHKLSSVYAWYCLIKYRHRKI